MPFVVGVYEEQLPRMDAKMADLFERYIKEARGGSMADGSPPIVTADSRPVKEAPDQPGGKEFPHKNKLIYDRLTNGDDQETEHLVPRQEDVAVPAMPPATATAGLPAPVASTGRSFRGGSLRRRCGTRLHAVGPTAE